MHSLFSSYKKRFTPPPSYRYIYSHGFSLFESIYSHVQGVCVDGSTTKGNMAAASASMYSYYTGICKRTPNVHQLHTSQKKLCCPCDLRLWREQQQPQKKWGDFQYRRRRPTRKKKEDTRVWRGHTHTASVVVDIASDL